MTLSGEQLSEAISDVMADLSRVFHGAEKSTLIRTPKDDVIRAQTRLQTVFGLKFVDESHKVIFETIMTHALSAEKLGPGGFDNCIQSLLTAYNTESGLELLKTSLEALRGSGTVIPTLADLQQVSLQKLPIHLKDVVATALNLAGFGGRIIIEKSRSEVRSVELVRGYTYNLTSAIPITGSTVLEPRICCIDGYVEGVHEIHHLLEEVTASKVSIALFVRGLADDVKQTLKVNYDRGILRVYPYVVPFDLEGINTLADIATATGTDVISSTKGQLISSIRVSDLVTIPTMTVMQNKIIMINPGSRDRVAAHVKYLRGKRAEQSDDSVARLFDLRIKALSPNQVLIRLPDNERYVVDSQAIDYSLRGVRSLIEHGSLGQDLAAARLAGLNHAIKCLELLNRLGALILRTN